MQKELKLGVAAEKRQTERATPQSNWPGENRDYLSEVSNFPVWSAPFLLQALTSLQVDYRKILFAGTCDGAGDRSCGRCQENAKSMKKEMKCGKHVPLCPPRYGLTKLGHPGRS